MQRGYFQLRDLLILVGVLASMPAFLVAATLGEWRRLRLARTAGQN